MTTRPVLRTEELVYGPVTEWELDNALAYVRKKYKTELDLRVSHVIGALESMGLQSVQLDTQGLIELFYMVYNPKTSANQKLADVNELRIETA